MKITIFVVLLSFLYNELALAHGGRTNILGATIIEKQADTIVTVVFLAIIVRIKVTGHLKPITRYQKRLHLT